MNIQWPAMLKHENHHALDYINDAVSFNEFIDNHYLPLTDNDYLIDSIGHQFIVTKTQPVLTFERIKTCEMACLNELLKAHLTDIGQCCISKFQVTNYKDAINTVKLSDQS